MDDMDDTISSTVPQWMKREVETRQIKGMAKYVREAVQARFEAEDAGKWESPGLDKHAVELRHEQGDLPLPDGGDTE